MIRRLTPKDILAAAQVEHEAFGDSNLTFTARQLEIELQRELSFLWGAFADDGSLLGVLIAWQVASDIELLNMAVARRAQRRGYGAGLLRTLLTHADARCTEEEHMRVFLEVRTDNAAALALYRAHGFESSRVRKGYYADGTDALEMFRVCQHV